jgi:predicted amidohydrolase YtcJ
MTQIKLTLFLARFAGRGDGAAVNRHQPNDTMKTTIRRNSKAIREILSAGYTAKAYSLDNGFSGESCALEWVRSDYDRFSFAKASKHGERVTIRVHGNLWYELTPELVTA